MILGAGRPHRGVDPSALAFISGSQRVLDWVIASFGALPSAEFHFVGGYRVEEIMRAFPGLHFTHNPDWASSGPVGSLVAAPISDVDTVFISYADIVFSPDVIDRLRRSTGDVALVVDAGWKTRYPRRGNEDLVHAEKILVQNGKVTAMGTELELNHANAEFVGVARFSGRAIASILRMTQADGRLHRAGFPELIGRLMGAGFTVDAVEADGEWAELNEPQDLATYVLRTKAETLEKIRPLVRRSKIEDQVHFSVGQWHENSQEILSRIQKRLPSDRLVVRSSAKSEDAWGASMAGKFSSVLGVSGKDTAAIAAAINEVISSYGDGAPDHLVLVQRMISAVAASGVVLTRTLSHGSPYYVINYDESGSTESVTAGTGRHQKVFFAHRSAKAPGTLPPRIQAILESVRELEALLHYDNLDVEFCLTLTGELVVFQVRRIAVAYDEQRALDEEVEAALSSAEAFLEQAMTPRKGILGSKTIFGVMPDWNPAEIIGTKPRPLALSIYQHLITDEIWARQRAEFGYRDVRPHPLLAILAGHPYVDVRASLNSFLPAAIDESIAEKLLEAQLRRLEANPHLHDKLEFEVALTCWNFSPDLGRLYPGLLSEEEGRALREHLKKITWNAILSAEMHLKQVERLPIRQSQTVGHPLRAAERELWNCREIGTIAFAHLARRGFVAKSILDSLVREGLLDSRDLECFLRSLHSVTKDYQVDAHLV
ncbi:MAG: hypothetical protein HUU37_04240, partial [Bdellovibrionales bacterium]|nr:hypothetical protein [Bdellovibrionales bacterium]